MVANPQPSEKKKNGMDFNFYINQMIIEEKAKNSCHKQVEQENDLPFHTFKKKPYLSIKDL